MTNPDDLPDSEIEDYLINVRAQIDKMNADNMNIIPNADEYYEAERCYDKAREKTRNWLTFYLFLSLHLAFVAMIFQKSLETDPLVVASFIGAVAGPTLPIF